MPCPENDPKPENRTRSGDCQRHVRHRVDARPPGAQGTASRWSREPKVRAAVESDRRRAVDRALGRMARRVTRATDGIAKLAKSAKH